VPGPTVQKPISQSRRPKTRQLLAGGNFVKTAGFTHEKTLLLATRFWSEYLAQRRQAAKKAGEEKKGR
jgi:hypothetical protein